MSTLKLKQMLLSASVPPRKKRNIPTLLSGCSHPQTVSRIENVLLPSRFHCSRTPTRHLFRRISPRFEVIYWRHFPLSGPARAPFALDRESLLRTPRKIIDEGSPLDGLWPGSCGSKLCFAMLFPIPFSRGVAWWKPGATPRRDENRSAEHYRISLLYFTLSIVEKRIFSTQKAQSKF